jgi:hypothetical protein
MGRELANTLQSLLFYLQALGGELVKIRVNSDAIGLVFTQHFVGPPDDRGRYHGQVSRHVQKMRKKRNGLAV